MSQFTNFLIYLFHSSILHIPSAEPLLNVHNWNSTKRFISVSGISGSGSGSSSGSGLLNHQLAALAGNKESSMLSSSSSTRG